MLSKFKNFLIPFLLCLQLSSCVVINSVDAVKPRDNFALTDDRTVIFFSVKVEGNTQGQPVSNTTLKRFFPGKEKLKARCFFYSYSTTVASVHEQDFGQRKYFAFKVLPGYYVLGLNETAQVVFKVESKKINYLGDFTKTIITPQTDHYFILRGNETIAVTKDLPSAEQAAKDFRSLNWSVVQAEEENLEGNAEPMPFCTL